MAGLKVTVFIVFVAIIALTSARPQQQSKAIAERLTQAEGIDDLENNSEKDLKGAESIGYGYYGGYPGSYYGGFGGYPYYSGYSSYLSSYPSYYGGYRGGLGGLYGGYYW